MRAVAVLAAVGFVAMAGFQAALALGAPIGRAAWGGNDTRLPRRLRVASAFAGPLFLLAALIILRRSGLRFSPISSTFAQWGTFVLAGLMALSAVANMASKSRWERFLWGPTALALAVLCLLTALSGLRLNQWG